MELIFQTKNGVQLYAVIKDDEILSFHSKDAHKIESALYEDLQSNDFRDRNMATMLLFTIARLGIEQIEG